MFEGLSAGRPTVLQDAVMLNHDDGAVTDLPRTGAEAGNPGGLVTDRSQ